MKTLTIKQKDIQYQRSYGTAISATPVVEEPKLVQVKLPGIGTDRMTFVDKDGEVWVQDYILHSEETVVVLEKPKGRFWRENYGSPYFEKENDKAKQLEIVILGQKWLDNNLNNPKQ
jgi:hypothetical protein